MLYTHQPINSLPNSYNIRFYDNVFWAMHFHKNLEAIYVLEGEVLCTLHGEQAVLRAGEYALCLSNEIHSYRSVGNSKCFVIVFAEDFVPSFCKSAQGKHGDKIAFRCSTEANAYLLKELINNPAPTPLRLKACLYTLCTEYLASVRLVEGSAPDDILMNRITDYVGAHYLEPITLSTMANALNYSYAYVSRQFSKIFQMPFTDYVNGYRIEHALTLLSNSKAKITDVALSSGFQSVRNFNHVFSQKLHVTPTEYAALREK